MRKSSRRTFLKTAGVATGAAIVGSVPGVAGATEEPGSEVVGKPSRLPKQPIVAVVRDARTGEVTIHSGLRETTYRDPALVKRLLRAAKGEVA
jgi:TAT (twin-arginine translocation) pathway signal sequence